MSGQEDARAVVFQLSDVELRVVRLAAEGLSNYGISLRMGLTEDTVKTHLYRVSRRTGVRSRSAMVGRAVLAGLIEPRPISPHAAQPKVSRREHDVLRQIARGMDTMEIAAALTMSKDTVKTHIRHLFEEFGTSNRAHLIKLAFDADVLKVELVRRKPRAGILGRAA